MPIPPAFEVRLAAYWLDDDDFAETRREIWALLEPRLDAIIMAHLDRTMKYAPVIAEGTRKNYATHQESIRRAYSRLFLSPFDEQWVADAETRARYEIERGIDMRSRATVGISILQALHSIIA